MKLGSVPWNANTAHALDPMVLVYHVKYGENALRVVPIPGRGGQRDERMEPNTLLTQGAAVSGENNVLDLWI